MSRQKKILQKRFVVFCEGDTEYNYIDKIRTQPGVQITLKPINMHGGGYFNFLTRIKKESQSNCLAKFIIIDGDRLKMHPEEKIHFQQLINFCTTQNKKGSTPHFLIINNPNFEYIACLHSPEYNNQEINRFLQTCFGFDSLSNFKSNEKIYERLNTENRSYQVMLQKIRNKEKFIKNDYSINKTKFEISIKKTNIQWDMLISKNSNIEEFFDIINW